MKSEIIRIDSQGNGMDEALDQAKKVAVFCELIPKAALQLQLMTEEMLCLARSVTGSMQASFWMEGNSRLLEIHMTTQTFMDREKRSLLLSVATSRKNEAAKSFLGRLRDAYEEAMTADATHEDLHLSGAMLADLPSGPLGGEDWDRYEHSVLRRLADDIRIGIRGENVEMTVSKAFQS